MIAWGDSDWSTGDALKAVGLTKASETCERTGLNVHHISQRGVLVASVGDVFACNAWLRATGRIS